MLNIISFGTCSRGGVGRGISSGIGGSNASILHRLETKNKTKLSIKNDSIKITKAIKLHSLTYEGKRDDLFIIDDALKNLSNIKQKEDERSLIVQQDLNMCKILQLVL